jgi:hypothetical protein
VKNSGNYKEQQTITIKLLKKALENNLQSVVQRFASVILQPNKQVN